ncbi:hypothetical protein ACHAPT_011222 [Fusarium lateritium]
MPSSVIISRFVAVSKEARQTVVNGLSKVAQSAQQLPGVVRYAITIPRDEADEKSISVIEEYSDQAAFNSHLGSKATTDLIALLSAGALLESPPTVSTFQTTSSYARSEVLNANDPYILIATFDYKEGLRAGALDGWQSVTSACQQRQPGTYVYVVSKDPKNADRVATVAVYESEKYFWDVHATDQAIVDNKVKYGPEIRTKTDLEYFKLVAGFLVNDQTRSKL